MAQLCSVYKSISSLGVTVCLQCPVPLGDEGNLFNTPEFQSGG